MWTYYNFICRRPLVVSLLRQRGRFRVWTLMSSRKTATLSWRKCCRGTSTSPLTLGYGALELVSWLKGHWLIDLWKVIDWLIGWLIKWWIDWLIDWLISWLVDWLTNLLIDRVIDLLIEWMIDWVIKLIEWFSYLLRTGISWKNEHDTGYLLSNNVSNIKIVYV